MLLGGCTTLGYYWQADRGEISILQHRRPISKVIADPKTSRETRQELKVAVKARRFAARRMDLPNGQSYRSYVALDRPYPVWVVYATPRFSLRPIEWCFPIAGCVPYRGYFSKNAADNFAKRMQKKGRDVLVTGAPAYSTLGWFADPIYSSMLQLGSVNLAGTIFHELAHQKVYVENAPVFNESFADAVESIGVRLFFSGRNAKALASWRKLQKINGRVIHAAEVARYRLREIYRSKAPAPAMAQAKKMVFRWLRQQYLSVERRFAVHYREHWIEQLNNASLVLLRTYDKWKPAFIRLYNCSHHNWHTFYHSVHALARMPKGRRRRYLQRLSLKGARSSNGAMKACVDIQTGGGHK